MYLFCPAAVCAAPHLLQAAHPPLPKKQTDSRLRKQEMVFVFCPGLQCAVWPTLSHVARPSCTGF